MLLIGIDCATVESKVGLALCEYAHGLAELKQLETGTNDLPPVDILCGWLEDRSVPALLAFDAPLGWPDALGKELSSHRAGYEIAVEGHLMFRRETDRFIKETLGKTPLDVGADRIARTALATLKLLGEMRERLNDEIQLAWSPNDATGLSAIEVYPAATLLAHGIRSTGYKNPDQGQALREVLTGIARVAIIGGVDQHAFNCADKVDAVVCVAAAKDFVEGRAVPPIDLEMAQKEGWIWSAKRSVSGL